MGGTLGWEEVVLALPFNLCVYDEDVTFGVPVQCGAAQFSMPMLLTSFSFKAKGQDGAAIYIFFLLLRPAEQPCLWVGWFSAFLLPLFLDRGCCLTSHLLARLLPPGSLKSVIDSLRSLTPAWASFCDSLLREKHFSLSQRLGLHDLDSHLGSQFPQAIGESEEITGV